MLGVDALYGSALPATRRGPLYAAFPYPTKISPETVALYIAAHTRPGDRVFDGFAGSGTTGLAALLCQDPPIDLRREASRRRLRVEWGPRKAVLYEISAMGAFVARMLNHPPDPSIFRRVAEQILRDVESEFGWLYAAEDTSGNKGCIRHVVWNDILRCPNCGLETPLWDACVSLRPARIDARFQCPSCKAEYPVGAVERVMERVLDNSLDNVIERRLRSMARVYGVTGTARWSRRPNRSDLELLDQVARTPIPACVPDLRVRWGDLYRSGYHHGISHVHHFYTHRNLLAFGRLWERANAVDGSLRDAIRFWLLSYNASHATIMTRVVAKSGQKDLAVTSAQPGVLYVSGLPVEKNVFRGLARKLSTITSAFASMHGRTGGVAVHQKSSCTVELPDGSVDYVFTDPPFGANIPYSEISMLNEAWLGQLTDATEEVIISKSQSKTVNGYRHLLARAFGEVNRILKPEGRATLVFHSASADVWNALRSAYTDAGLGVEHAGILDKRQQSFKQVTTNGAVRGDPVLLLRKRSSRAATTPDCPWQVAKEIHLESLNLGRSERAPERLYSRFVNYFLANNQEVPINAGDFYQWYAEQQSRESNRSA
ncbi:MAG: DNA methyltransferase [Gammaproteobacteria bacterium]|nr:DNA methyltransferase [Gammaproteobacteria bacterium]